MALLGSELPQKPQNNPVVVFRLRLWAGLGTTNQLGVKPLRRADQGAHSTGTAS
jgi:hypothetical protein